MKRIIDIPEEMYKVICRTGSGAPKAIDDVIRNSESLPKYMEELKSELLMEVDGGTDDRYLKYADICDRISNTIDIYIKAK